MDINRTKRLIIPTIESGKMVSAVRKTIRQEQDDRQEKYEEQKEVYRPIVEKLEKEIDEISGLREEYVKSASAPLAYKERLAITDGSENKTVANMNKGFTEYDLGILQKHEFPLPSEVLVDTMSDPVVVDRILGVANNINKELGRQQGNLSTTKNAKIFNKDKIDKYAKEIKSIKKYKDRLQLIKGGVGTIQTGKGIYTQPKRNAYKISPSGQYGTLKIDMPKLIGQLKLIAYKDGNKVYDKRVDFDTLDLFTKRYNNNKKYSNLSRRVFDEINSLSDIPIHRTSKKYSKIGSGVVYYNNPEDLLDRLELLGGSIQAGNDSVKDEFSEIAHTLRKLNVIDHDQFEEMMNDYII